MGEVAFTTAMTGYHELLTDPATWGQLLAFTYPLIGNCGVNDEDAESDTVHAHAVIAAEIARFPSHFRAAESLPTYLRRQGVIAVEGVDTAGLGAPFEPDGTFKRDHCDGRCRSRRAAAEVTGRRAKRAAGRDDQSAPFRRLDASGDRGTTLPRGTGCGSTPQPPRRRGPAEHPARPRGLRF